MSTPQNVFVTILDKEYQIACPAEEKEALLNSAHMLDERMRKIRSSGSVIGVERIAVMAALNLCHELLQSNDKEDNLNTIAQLENLNTRLAGALSQIDGK